MDPVTPSVEGGVYAFLTIVGLVGIWAHLRLIWVSRRRNRPGDASGIEP